MLVVVYSGPGTENTERKTKIDKDNKLETGKSKQRDTIAGRKILFIVVMKLVVALFSTPEPFC